MTFAFPEVLSSKKVKMSPLAPPVRLALPAPPKNVSLPVPPIIWIADRLSLPAEKKLPTLEPAPFRVSEPAPPSSVAAARLLL